MSRMTLLPDSLPLLAPQAELTYLGTKTMQQATQLQWASPGRAELLSSAHPQFPGQNGDTVFTAAGITQWAELLSAPIPISKTIRNHCIHSPRGTTFLQGDPSETAGQGQDGSSCPRLRVVLRARPSGMSWWMKWT